MIKNISKMTGAKKVELQGFASDKLHAVCIAGMLC